MNPCQHTDFLPPPPGTDVIPVDEALVFPAAKARFPADRASDSATADNIVICFFIILIYLMT